MKNAATAIVEILSTIADMVDAKGPMGLPKGELYAILMPYGAGLAHLDMLTTLLVESGRVRVRGNLLLPA